MNRYPSTHWIVPIIKSEPKIIKSEPRIIKTEPRTRNTVTLDVHRASGVFTLLVGAYPT